MKLRYRQPNTEQAVGEFAALLTASFGFGLPVVRRWLERVEHENLRVVMRGDRVVGGLMAIPMGQFFGGRSVSTVGVAGVGVASAERGKGTATELMRAFVRELHADGVALSTLYPATLPLYRRAGYEISGGLHRLSIQARDIAGPRRDAKRSSAHRTQTTREIGPDDEPAIESLYQRFAAQRHGWLDRGTNIWMRTRRDRDDAPAHGVVTLDQRGRVDGYLRYRSQRRGDTLDLELTDLVYGSPAAAETLLAVLADQRSLTNAITWPTAPDDPFVTLLRERFYAIERRHMWMLRLVRVADALAQRGYAANVSGRIALEVRDDFIADNCGVFRVSVAGGQATVKRGKRGQLALDVRTLAALYSGHHRASQLAAMGRIQATAKTIALADHLFASPPPSMADMF